MSGALTLLFHDLTSRSPLALFVTLDYHRINVIFYDMKSKSPLILHCDIGFSRDTIFAPWHYFETTVLFSYRECGFHHCITDHKTAPRLANRVETFRAPVSETPSSLKKRIMGYAVKFGKFPSGANCFLENEFMVDSACDFQRGGSITTARLTRPGERRVYFRKILGPGRLDPAHFVGKTKTSTVSKHAPSVSHR